MITIWFVTEAAKLHFICFSLPFCPGINWGIWQDSQFIAINIFVGVKMKNLCLSNFK